MNIFELIDKIPDVIKVLVCAPVLLGFWVVLMVWIGILVGVIKREQICEQLPDDVSLELEPDELLDGDR